MNPRFLNHLVIRNIAWSKAVAWVKPPAIPDTTNIVARKNLYQPTCFCMADLNEPRVE
jgi:hypothetical protein